MKKLFHFILTTLILVAGCGSVVVDPSIPAVQAGDYTLALSACEAMPGGGADICRVTDGAAIESSWTLIVPYDQSQVMGGEVDVFFKDIHKSYPITGKVVSIPWRDVMGVNQWSSDQHGLANALVSIQYKDAQGIVQTVQFEGYALIVVNAANYTRMPIDSGYAAFKTTCKVQYSTAGRGAVSCQ